MRFHCLSLPHTQTTKEYIACAYTMKAKRFCDMMTSLGHQVFLYASEENDAKCDELITIAPKSDQLRWFGTQDRQKFFNITWNRNDEHWVVTNRRAVEEINRRIQPKDFICVIGGNCQQDVAEAFPNHLVVEYGIGYSGVFADFKVFESYAHMHFIYGRMDDDNGKFYDAVIPNYFDPDEFTFSAEKDDYYVFLGRFTQRKGPEIAVEATRRLGKKLIMAGQGARQEGSTVYSDEGWSVSGDHIEHIGHVNVEQRAKLLSRAKATFMPTTYLEPFGGVSIESLFSGTPVIATDFGVFTETIPHGLAGYRFRTLGEATRYAAEAENLDPYAIRDYANKFSMNTVKYKYRDYFYQLMTLWEDGFYSYWSGRSDRYI
jgi:glycosyltransferase involved in cell wall biosynthesis